MFWCQRKKKGLGKVLDRCEPAGTPSRMILVKYCLARVEMRITEQLYAQDHRHGIATTMRWAFCTNRHVALVQLVESLAHLSASSVLSHARHVSNHACFDHVLECLEHIVAGKRCRFLVDLWRFVP